MVYRSDGSDDRPGNVFRNDGSFLEMFKKLQESQKIKEASSSGGASAAGNNDGSSKSSGSTDSPSEADKKPIAGSAKPAPFVGKRRGGRVLPTGKVKKRKIVKEEEVSDGPKDAWSVYLEEVKRYKETTCEEDEKTRPLVK